MTALQRSENGWMEVREVVSGARRWVGSSKLWRKRWETDIPVNGISRHKHRDNSYLLKK